MPHLGGRTWFESVLFSLSLSSSSSSASRRLPSLAYHTIGPIPLNDALNCANQREFCAVPLLLPTLCTNVELPQPSDRMDSTDVSGTPTPLLCSSVPLAGRRTGKRADSHHPRRSVGLSVGRLNYCPLTKRGQSHAQTKPVCPESFRFRLIYDAR